VAGSITATIEQTVRRPVAHTQAEANSENKLNEGAVNTPAAPREQRLPGRPCRAHRREPVLALASEACNAVIPASAEASRAALAVS
jgi:hypothetical protein